MKQDNWENSYINKRKEQATNMKLIVCSTRRQ